MEVCVLLEGSYPYVAGGVSSWIYFLMSQLSDIDFKLVSIMPSRKEELDYKYPVPDNVLEIKTIYLDDFKQLKTSRWQREPKIDDREIAELTKFFGCQEDIDWQMVTEIICDSNRIGNAVEFLQSKTFWEILLKVYQQQFSQQGFNQYFWTMRSIFLPVIHIMQQKLPTADIYHSLATGYAGLLGLLAQIKYNQAFILTEHGIYAREREEEILKTGWIEGNYKQLLIDFFYFLSTGVYRNADRVISLFNRNREIQLKLGALPDKTMVLPNGVDLDRFTTEKEEHQGLNLGAIVRIVPIKDIKTLIKAFKLVNNELSNVKLYLIGPYEEDKEYYLECKKLIKKLDLEEDIIITGRVEVTDYLKKLDLLVLTSISEGQPLVMLEGFAAEIPFVATDVGSCRELIEGGPEDDLGSAGIITNPASYVETAEAIIKLLQDKELRTEMGKIGCKRVEKYYNQEELVNNYQQLYEQLGGC
ncbi:GT4 family glycosyltransferase PelF [Sporohalobacter salinus]|uniref:GT4 family glycosyltransferase PelF n=1 Tax=Sporohalobacter salinus TaxID=1494606 RepID=UPI0019616BE6|nr:GT4 family glycosyltransferase PelF [Sporohalobacter salinus]MBM7624820.1 glycosyltransferase involved in cell wall biosynthesis [Sporohalobacter salinus]